MKNMRVDDLKNAAEQLKYTRPDEMAEIGEKMANASPAEIASMRARFESQVEYEMNASEMLKKQGNELHSKGRYEEASEKYILASKNLKGIPSSKSRPLALACSRNLMSCYLKTKQYDECITEGSKVLEYDAKNVKALYRRGQAYKELGRFKDAISDLRKASEVSPDDETITLVLREAEERLPLEGLIIEEITESDGDITSEVLNGGSMGHSAAKQQTTDSSADESLPSRERRTHSDLPEAISDDSEATRSFQSFISNANPETLAAFGGKAGAISPDMFKTASNMIGKMPPEELQRVLRMASQFQGENQFNGAGSSDRTGSMPVPPNVTPDMHKTASDMMGKMSPEELGKMFEMASSIRGNSSAPSGAAPDLHRLFSNSGSVQSDVGEKVLRTVDNINSEVSSSSNFLTGSREVSQPTFPSSTADIQEQMRNQMNNPETRRMFTSMMKNISPEMISNMSEQFGLKLSPEDAAKAQQAMSSMSPEALDKMMLWTDRIQRGIGGARKAKNWLLGRQGMIFAVCMLILALLINWLFPRGR